MKRTFLILIPVLYLSIIYSQSVDIKDSGDNSLIQINDEGTAGSISIPDATTVGTPTSKLYNIGGSIFWSGTPLGVAGSAGGWTDDGAIVRLSTITDKVGIGTASPLSKLSVGGNGNADWTIHAENAEDTGRGVYGWAKGINGCGIAGFASNTSGVNYGIYGGTVSPNGYAGYFSGRGYFSSNVGIGTTTPDEALHISGNIRLEGTFEDKDGQAGNSGQVLTSTSTGTDWVTLSSGGADGNTLDQAYDQGGAGVGRTIIADAGAFRIEGVDGALFSGTFDSGSIPATGQGTRMMWYPKKAAFRAGSIGGTQWDDVNIGDYSTALGYGTQASGWGSVALGSGTQASGWGSVALGGQTQAIGTSSSAHGYQTKAESYASFVIGRVNVGGGSSTTWIEADPLFEIGIGTIPFSDDKNAMTVLKNGKVGIKTHTPNAGLEVTHNDGVVFSGMLGSGSIPAVDGGIRMMWYPKKAAFRAGSIGGTQWDDVNIGIASQAMGVNTISSGDYSFSCGNASIASGENSVAMVSGTASGNNSIAIGGTASVNNSTSIKGLASASGAIAIAGGSASGSQSIAIGYETQASQQWSTAIGSWNEASGISATAIGNSALASGNNSISMGLGTKAEALCSVAIGRENIGGGSPNSWNDTDPLFEIGNSNPLGVRSNAMTVLKNGNVGINTATPAVTLEVSGTDAVQLTVGTTAEQPSSPTAGMIRFNTETSKFEGYDGSSWVNLH